MRSHTLAGAATHVGRRPNNEDGFLVEPSLGLFAVADGMGGYEGGEVASELSLQQLQRSVAAGACAPALEDVLREAFARSQAAVCAAHSGALREMGSTLSALWLRKRRAAIAHVGDSRIYRLRAGTLEQLTRDHSLAQELRDRGVALPDVMGLRNMLSRAVGTPHATPDLQHLEPAPGDVFLLCSDGLHGALDAAEISRLLAAQQSPERTAEALVAQAYEAGGQDNITAVVVKVPEAESGGQTEAERE